MPVMKRATKRLQQAGYPTLRVHRGVWGYYCMDTRYKMQRGTPARDTVEEVFEDVVEAGRRPRELLQAEVEYGYGIVR